MGTTEAVVLGVWRGLEVKDGLGEFVSLGLPVGEGVADEDAVEVGVGVADGETLGVTDGETLGVTDGDVVRVGVGGTTGVTGAVGITNVGMPDEP